MTTVIVPVRNDASGIVDCIRAIEQQTVPLRIIVVDDGSTDATARDAHAAGAEVLCQGSCRGAAAARNRGLDAVESEFVLFTDADCCPDPQWAERLIAAFRPGVVATKGTYRSEQAGMVARFVQSEYEERYRRMAGRVSIDFLDTYALAVRSEALRSIGAFNAAFAGATVEDQEMSFRLLERGQFLFVADAVVRHRHADSLRAYARKKFRIGRGKATIARRYPERLRADSHTPNGLRWQLVAVYACLAFGTAAAIGELVLPSHVSRALALVAGVCAPLPIVLSAPLLAAVSRSRGGATLPVALVIVIVRAWSLALGFAYGCVRPSIAVAALESRRDDSERAVADRSGEVEWREDRRRETEHVERTSV